MWRQSDVQDRYEDKGDFEGMLRSCSRWKWIWKPPDRSAPSGGYDCTQNALAEMTYLGQLILMGPASSCVDGATGRYRVHRWDSSVTLSSTPRLALTHSHSCNCPAWQNRYVIAQITVASRQTINLLSSTTNEGNLGSRKVGRSGYALKIMALTSGLVTLFKRGGSPVGPSTRLCSE